MVDANKKSAKISVNRTKLESFTALLKQELAYLPKKTVEMREKKRYEALVEILCDFEVVKSVLSSVHETLSLNVVKLLESKEKFLPLLTKLLRLELFTFAENAAVSDSKTLLETSLTSALVQTFVRVTPSFLHSAMKADVLEILEKAKSDNWQFSASKNASENVKKMCTTLTNKVLSAANSMPSQIKEVLKIVKSELDKKFGDNKKVNTENLTAVFWWSHLFAPALLNPKKFGITDKNLDSKQTESVQLFHNFVGNIFAQLAAKNSPNLQPFNDLVDSLHPKVVQTLQSILSSVKIGQNHTPISLNREINNEVLPAIYSFFVENLDDMIASIRNLLGASNSARDKKLIDQLIRALAAIKAQQEKK